MNVLPDSLHVAIDALPEPLFIISEDGKCLFANSAFFKVLNAKKENNVTLKVGQFWPAYTKTKGEFLSELKTFSGEVIPVKVEQSLLSNNSRLIRVLAVGPKNDSWSQFHTQRLETLGMLAGGVAHDFNNILTGILGHVSYLKTVLPKSGPHVESLSAIEDGARKSSAITQQILNFSRFDPSDEASRIDLGQIIKRTASLLRGAISVQYQFEYSVPDEPVWINAVEGKLTQIIANLAINARDAIEINGKIEIKLSVDNSKKAIDKLLVNGKEGVVVLSVVDNGCGMTEETQKRIFEPFFSTKKGKGTGLGLATVAAIVQEYGGYITVSSERNVGTNISICLPQDNSESDSEENKEEMRLPRGDEKILVIDDEFPVRSVVALSLEHLGYTVVSAASGIEGLELYIANPKDFSLVILDVLMPKMSGDEVFFQMKKINPDVKVLLMSGYTSEDTIKKVLDGGGKDFIQKPFTIQDLAVKVRDCID